MGGGLHGYLFGVLGREACAALGAVGGCDGDGAPRREARGLGAVSRDFQHLHGPGGGWRTQALCRLEGCCRSDEDCARWDGSDGWRGAEQVEAEAAFCEGGDAGGEPVAVEAVPGLLAWGGLRLAPGCVGGLGALILHHLCDAQPDGAEYVLGLG